MTNFAKNHRDQGTPSINGMTDQVVTAELRFQHLTKDQKAVHIASKKETVADDTANSSTSIASRVSQTTLSDLSKNLEEPSPTENEEETDDQTRSMDSQRETI